MILKLFLAAVVVCLVGCQSYQARPLVPHDVVLNVERARHIVDEENTLQHQASTSVESKTPFTFVRAARLMGKYSPAIRQAEAEYQTALALAKVKTPLPNPTIEAGPKFGFGPDVMRRPVEPFGSIGFSIPTGKRLKRQDELNQLSAQFALVEKIATHRELYIQLRKLYSELSVSYSRVALRKTIVGSAENSVSLTKRMMGAGQATSIDLALLELEFVRIQGDTLNGEREIATIEGQLSKLIGVHTEHFISIPTSPLTVDVIPSLKDLQEILIASHPELARQKARYSVAEAELRLEIAKQYPDFRVGPSAEGDINDRKTILGLTLGIDIPAFDRNQQAIATALNRREEIRIRYEGEANKALASLDQAWRLYTLALEKSKLVKNVLLPKAEESLQLGRKSLDAGLTDSLRFLEMERTHRSLLIDSLETELSVRQAIIDCEQAIGYPLFLFPGEEPEQLPPLPQISSEKLDATPAQ